MHVQTHMYHLFKKNINNDDCYKCNYCQYHLRIQAIFTRLRFWVSKSYLGVRALWNPEV